MLNTTRPFPRALLTSAALLLAACTGVTGADLEIKPILVDAVDVKLLESFPVQVHARVQGVLGDGCTEIESVTQARAGGAVTVTILSKRPKDAMCTQIAKTYDETIALDGGFPPGSYTLRVNAHETTFRVD
jgi:inhibitor of cysteine peptidase